MTGPAGGWTAKDGVRSYRQASGTFRGARGHRVPASGEGHRHAWL